MQKAKKPKVGPAVEGLVKQCQAALKALDEKVIAKAAAKAQKEEEKLQQSCCAGKWSNRLEGSSPKR